ncbi:exported hypothetical protein [Paraburkholderia ribeironis]|uniref:Uncharacterized protein n=1 Tax=Paraburkholderia ribeironis TaxID=1247936 RepID=A0A1N7SF44_9BURK|nr:exported hypothetical protein [Paraburkholderia ribeironis]
MLKKLLMLCVALALSLSAAFAAAVEVNSADQAALESVKGIGPVHAKAIIDERTKNGPFKDADDLAARVKGLGSAADRRQDCHEVQQHGRHQGGARSRACRNHRAGHDRGHDASGACRSGQRESVAVEEEEQGRGVRSSSFCAGRSIRHQGLEEEGEKEQGCFGRRLWRVTTRLDV